jgi:hypothetical protein
VGYSPTRVTASDRLVNRLAPISVIVNLRRSR